MTIKRTPEDFSVEEVLTSAAMAAISDRPGPVAVYRLSKRGLSTPEAAARLAKALRVAPEGVVFGGLKDKHAATVQHVSLTAGRGPAAVAGRNWQARRLGWTDAPLAAASIAANRFRIRLADLPARACAAMDAAAGRLAAGPAGVLRFVNYFGRQRFGSARHGRGFLARHLIAGDFEGALRLAIATPARKDRLPEKRFKRDLTRHWGRWAEALRRLPRCPERAAVEELARGGDFRAAFAALPYFIQQISVEAYQSYLWNAIAAELVLEVCPAGGIWEAREPFGPMRFAAAAAIPPALAGLDLPLPGPRTRLAPPWADAAEAVLARHGLTAADLRIPGLRRPFFGQAPRRWLAEAAGFAMSAPTPQPPARPPGQARRTTFSRTLSFDLPRGAYATVLLAALT